MTPTTSPSPKPLPPRASTNEPVMRGCTGGGAALRRRPSGGSALVIANPSLTQRDVNRSARPLANPSSRCLEPSRQQARRRGDGHLPAGEVIPGGTAESVPRDGQRVGQVRDDDGERYGHPDVVGATAELGGDLRRDLVSGRPVLLVAPSMAGKTRMAVALISPGWHGSPAVRMSRSRLRRAPAGGISPRNWPWLGSPIAQDLTWRRPQRPANDMKMAPSTVEPPTRNVR
jgi:hypothetical protein